MSAQEWDWPPRSPRRTLEGRIRRGRVVFLRDQAGGRAARALVLVAKVALAIPLTAVALAAAWFLSILLRLA